MTDQPTNSASIEPQAPHADGGNTDFETEAEHQAVAEVPTQPVDATGMTSGLAAPPSPLLDTEESGSDWDHESFVPVALEDMPKEGPGSPGYDVYAPENVKRQTPQADDQDISEEEAANRAASNDDDVKAALEAETFDGPGETPVDQLPESDVDPDEELADEYPDLEPRGDDLPDDTKDNA